MKALSLGIDIDQIVNPCVMSAYQDKESVIKELSDFVENPDEIVEKLSNLYERKETKKCLIVGTGKDWDFFHAVAKWKKDVEVIGAFNYENREVIVSSNKTRMISEFEIDKIACDYFLVMDPKYLNYLTAIDIHNMQKVIVPYTTGFENTKFEVVIRLNNILENAEEVVDYLSIRRTVGKGMGNMRPMKYDLIGYSLLNDRHTWEKHKMSMMQGDYARVRNLELLIEELKNRDAEGAVAEVGVFRGDFAKILSYYFPEKELYLYDTFEGYDSEDLEFESREREFNYRWASKAFKSTSLENVKEYIGNASKCHYRQGYFPKTIKEKEKQEKFCLVSLDANLYSPTFSGLEFFYPRLVKGGYILLHEYNFCWLDGDKKILFPGIKKAVKDYENKVGHICYVPITDQNGTLVITK